MVENIFFQLSILLGITVSLAFVIRMLKQPLVVAYILSGIIAGPIFFDVLKGSENLLQSFAQFGIVLLLFVVGLNLNFKHLKVLGRDIFLGGTLQFLFTSLAGWFIMRFLGFGWMSSLFVAIAVTFSSTIIIVKLLADKKDSETLYGRYVIGLLVVQDLIAIGLLMFFNDSKPSLLSWDVQTILFLAKMGILAGGFISLLPMCFPKSLSRFLIPTNFFLFLPLPGVLE